MIRADIHGEISAIYATLADGRYGLAALNQRQHALQSAALAERAGAPASLIVACLLHDIGHMIHDLGDTPAAAGVDDRHEILGADWLAARFGPSVSEPVRLHVLAKRYLCAVEPGYARTLSPDSVLSLSLQGGPMTPAECEAFAMNEWFAHATALRRFDDRAKDPRARPPGFEYFLRDIDPCLK